MIYLRQERAQAHDNSSLYMLIIHMMYIVGLDWPHHLATIITAISEFLNSGN